MRNGAVFEALAEKRLVPVVAMETPKDALPVADALQAGGLPVVEVTFRTAAAAETIAVLTQARPTLLIGAGTILSVENLEKAKAAGAAFGVAPGLNPRVVARAAELGMPFIPGVATPTEIEAAMGLGCRVLKFFPSGVLGGLKTLTAMVAPYLHTGVQFMPTGGVNAANLGEYLAAKFVIAVGGTWLATKDDLQKEAWAAITDKCRQCVAIRNSVHGKRP